MGVAERKSREKEERRRLIIDYAKELIMEHGVDSVTMLDIAKKAELSKATLYLYFRSKEAILEAILEEAGSYFIEYVHSVLDYRKTGIELLRDLWKSYIKIFGESNDIFICIGIKNYLEPGFPLVREVNSLHEHRTNWQLLKMISSTIRKGLEDGTLDRTVDPDKLAGSLILIGSGIVETVARLPRSMRNAKNILSEMKSTFELIMRGVAAEGTDRSLLTLSIPE